MIYIVYIVSNIISGFKISVIYAMYIFVADVLILTQ